MRTGVASDDKTLLDSLARQVAGRPDAPAFRRGGASLTFADIERASNRLANALAARGIGRGDRVALLTKLHAECLVTTIACCKVGAVAAPVNWRLAPDELRYILEHAEARLLIADAAFSSALEDVAPAGTFCLAADAATARLPALADWSAPYPDTRSPSPVHEDDAALQLYSSGTTGRPKGVVLTHKGLVCASRVGVPAWGLGETSVLANALPTFHIAGMALLFQTLYAGAETVAFPDFVPEVFIDGIGRYGVTHTFVVPAMLLFMLQSPKVGEGDYRTLKVISYGASPISETLLKNAMRAFGCEFLQVYGLTEVSGPATYLAPADHHVEGERAKILRSAGKPAPETRIRVVDPATFEPLPEGQTGEVLIETIRNLEEYWRDPEATRLAFPEGRNPQGGWFRTGDAGYFEDGYLYIHDRIKDMIISGGENIYPAEIENVLMTHPAVADAAVIGVPDATWGEAVKACVALKPGARADEAEIVGWLRQRIAHYKSPRSVDFVEALPRNPSGKILKRILREPYWKGASRAVN